MDGRLDEVSRGELTVENLVVKDARGYEGRLYHLGQVSVTGLTRKSEFADVCLLDCMVKRGH